HARADVEREHRRLGQIGLEKIALDELHAARDAVGGRRLPRDAYQVGLELDANGAGAEVLGGVDGNATVPGPEGEHYVVWRGVGELQHAVDEPLGRRHPDRVLLICPSCGASTGCAATVAQYARSSAASALLTA